MRILIVVPPLAGHVNPTVAVGAELARRGHPVLWAGPACGVAPVLAPGQRVWDTNPEFDRAALESMVAGELGQRGMIALKGLWQRVLLPLARVMTPGVERVCDAFRPDLVLADQQALAGSVVALKRCLPWATSASTSVELANPLSALPKVDAWLRAEIARLQAEAGLSAETSGVDPRCSPLLTIAYTTEALAGRVDSWPGPLILVGPVVADRAEPVPFPWERLDPSKRTVLVTLGSLNGRAGGRFFAVAIEALSDRDIQAVLVAVPESMPQVPAGTVVVGRVPQVALLRRGLSAVVCHGGHNTVTESLAFATPLVVAPIRDDQPLVAEQVVRAGVGVRVRFGRAGVGELHRAVRAVLDEPRYRGRAAAVARSFAEAGGAAAAVDRLEALV